MWADLPLALLSRDQGTVIDVLQTFKYPSAKPQDCLTSRNFLLSGSKTDESTKDLREIFKVSFMFNYVNTLNAGIKNREIFPGNYIHYSSPVSRH